MLALYKAKFPTAIQTGIQAGVDLSGWQPASIWDKLGWAGWSCAKVSEGAFFTELSAIDHSQAAKDRGIPWGLYHFAKFTDVEAEAERYLVGLRMVESRIGPPKFHMLDLEAPASGDVTAWSERWCQIVEQASPLPVIIYTGPGWAQSHLNDRSVGLGRRALWVAHYANAGTEEPWVPDLWSDWAIWQWTSTSQLGSLDLNVAKDTWLASLDAVPAPDPVPVPVDPPALIAPYDGDPMIVVEDARRNLWLVDGWKYRLIESADWETKTNPMLVAWARAGVIRSNPDGSPYIGKMADEGWDSNYLKEI